MSTKYNPTNPLKKVRNAIVTALCAVNTLSYAAFGQEQDNIKEYLELFKSNDSISLEYKGHGSKFFGFFSVEGAAELYLAPDSASASIRMEPKSFYSGLDMTIHTRFWIDEETQKLERIIIRENYDNHQDGKNRKKIENLSTWSRGDSTLYFHQKVYHDSNTTTNKYQKPGVNPDETEFNIPYVLYKFLADPQRQETIQIYLGGEVREFPINKDGGSFKIPFEQAGWSDQVKYIIINRKHIEEISKGEYLREFKVETPKGTPKFKIKK